MATMIPPVKLKWLEHLNSSWITEDSESIATREGVAVLYSKLVSNKEVVPLPQQVLCLKGPQLPDFERESLSSDEQDHYLDALLSSQLALAKMVCSDSPFAGALRKRLLVLQRVFYALSNKYHDKGKVKQQQHSPESSSGSADVHSVSERPRSSTDALIEMGVRTGLSLLFALLRQSWMMPVSGPGLSLCNDVIHTAIEVVSSLPPLSLANESKIPPMGLDCLSQVTTFLKGVTIPNSGADTLGRRLASELLLGLAAQRGSLRYLLEWIEMALGASAVVHTMEKSKLLSSQEGMISFDCFMTILMQMRRSLISENQDSADVDPQEHSFTRTIDEEAEMEEQAERDREEGHPEPEDEEEEREHEVMTAGKIFQCFLSAREVARSRDRDRMNSGAGSGARADDPPPQSQQERRVSTDLPEGQDVYTAACNSVIHRCALLILGVSPVIDELQKRREEGQLQQPSTSASEGGGLMTRSESLTAESRLVHGSPNYRLIKSRSESDLSQPESDEEGYALSGRRNVDLDLAASRRKRGPMHSQLESLSDSWARLKHSRDWLCNSSYSFESDFDLTKSLGVHTLIENVVSFVSGDVGNAPGFKEPEESMSTSPQASIIAMEQQQLRAELRLEALHQILVLLSGMEEKGSISLAGSRLSSGFQSSTLLTSVRLQFLAGCFGLGTVGHTGAKGESGRLHHYQ
ncbi:HERC1 isoform 1, partial [Pongo abelii]